VGSKTLPSYKTGVFILNLLSDKWNILSKDNQVSGEHVINKFIHLSHSNETEIHRPNFMYFNLLLHIIILRYYNFQGRLERILTMVYVV
jgi:hypothetical protein